MQPLTANTVASPNRATGQPAQNAGSDQGNSGVVLRWRTSERINNGSPSADQGQANVSQGLRVSQGITTSASANLAARAPDSSPARPQSGTPFTGQSSSYAASSSTTSSTISASTSNPLRSSTASSGAQPTTSTTATFVPRGTHASGRSAVQPANFQAPAGNASQAPRGNSSIDNAIAPPSFPTPNSAPGLQAPPALGAPNFPPAVQSQDALNAPEAAPAPPLAPPAQDAFPQTPELSLPPAQDSNPASPMPDTDNELRLPGDKPENTNPPKDDEAANPFKNRSADELESPSDRESARRSRELEKKKDQPDSSANCESFRDKLKNSSIQKINLNAAPRYGQGMNDDPAKSEKQRLDFASSSEVRDWCDRHGRAIIQGRMIDLVNEQVVLDINGVRREIPLRDLCDIDLAYVGKVWHLPVTCGSGYDQVAGRSFAPSAIQWKASGLCHKPLYFEEVQLERYGHEIGPVLQPLVSTAHFFGNIAVLPYKMGIHPPSECQYALGYYRPGDCAPYMLPPVPISLRGAAVQAGAVVGAAALVP